MPRPDADLALMRDGEAFFLAQVAALADGVIAQPTLLPGWTRAHLLAHIARNARALSNLLTWARTGVETPMYPSPEKRATDIDDGARQPVGALRADAVEASARLVDLAASMPEPAWDGEVRSALGRALPASGVPWMRIRETWIHAIDLGTGASFVDLPAGVLDRLLDETTARLATVDDCPPMAIRDATSGREWLLGTGARVEVRGSSPALVAWLLGREVADELGTPPVPPRWL